MVFWYLSIQKSPNLTCYPDEVCKKLVVPVGTIFAHVRVLPTPGGHALFGTASIDIYLKRFTISTEFRLPVYTDLAKGTSKTGAQIMGQVAVMF